MSAFLSRFYTSTTQPIIMSELLRTAKDNLHPERMPIIPSANISIYIYLLYNFLAAGKLLITYKIKLLKNVSRTSSHNNFPNLFYKQLFRKLLRFHDENNKQLIWHYYITVEVLLLYYMRIYQIYRVSCSLKFWRMYVILW